MSKSRMRLDPEERVLDWIQTTTVAKKTGPTAPRADPSPRDEIEDVTPDIAHSRGPKGGGFTEI